MNRLWLIAALLVLAALLILLLRPSSGTTVTLPGNRSVHLPFAATMLPLPPPTSDLQVLAHGSTSDRREGFSIGLIPRVRFGNNSNADVKRYISEQVPAPYGGGPVTSHIQQGHIVFQSINRRQDGTYFLEAWETDAGVILLVAVTRSPEEASKIAIDLNSGNK